MISDVLDYSELTTENAYILFLDFYQAFDSVEHEFIWILLKNVVLGILSAKLLEL